MRVMEIRAQKHEGFTGLLDEMHELRAKVFAGRLGWKVTITDGRERDEYDDLDPTYILALTDAGRVAGCARLLPCTGPTMLMRTFPQLLATGFLPDDPMTIESSRFCVDTKLEGRGVGSLHEATLTMFAGIIEWSMTNGYREIATATDVRFERILQRAGWPMKRLGAPLMIGETMSVAGTLPADSASFERVCPSNYTSSLPLKRRTAA